VVDRGTTASELRDLVRSLAEDHGWPLFAKSDTELGLPPGLGSRHIVVTGEADLPRLAEFVRVRDRVLVQERIAGRGCGIAGLFVRGAPACVGGHVRLREAHATGGVSTYCEARVVGGALRSALALMEHLRWTGVAMVEFKLPPDGPPALMEVNPRFWGTLPLYVRAGADVPRAALEHALHGVAPPQRPFEEGRRMRFLLSDLAAIRRQYRGARRLGELGLALLETPWVTPDATFSLRDPVPFLADVRALISTIAGRALSAHTPGRRRVA
jgi:predicted ATP-grasp superfamily ATP-dependent carboligase